MIRLKNRFGKANRKEMSWMSDLMETLRQEGISPDLLRAVEEYRAAHALPEALRPRIPVSGFTYYGREVWEQALAALLCGENLLLAGGKATGKNVLAENLAAAFGRLCGWGGHLPARAGLPLCPVRRLRRAGRDQHGQKRGPGRPPRRAGLPPRH